ncbi:MAG: hypothetical protein OXE82_08655 [Rhodobacter sp.]|nr:hypothetical protein [Rhodobacter sp.]
MLEWRDGRLWCASNGKTVQGSSRIGNRLYIERIMNYILAIRSTAVRLAYILGVGLVIMSKADPLELFFQVYHAQNWISCAKTQGKQSKAQN